MMVRYVVVSFLFVLMIGCSDNNDNRAQKQGNEEQTRKTVIDPQLEALERAKAVEQDVLDAAEKQRKEIDEQSDG